MQPTPAAIPRRAARHLHVFGVACVSQWRTMTLRDDFVASVLNATPRFALLAWIADQSGDASVVTTVTIGIVLMVIWTAAIRRVGFALRYEATAGTLDLNLLGRSPLAFITLGKSAAITLSFVPNGIFALLVVLLITREPLAIAHIPPFLVSMTLALVALLTVAFIFVPATFMIGSRAGSFNAITPFVAVLSGFVYPLSVLPGWLEAAARLLPTSWAMETVRWSLAGGYARSDFAAYWAVAIALTLLYASAAAWQFGIAERRIRRTGNAEGGF